MTNNLRISLDEPNWLEWRPTPWDERIFEKKTAELLGLQFTTEANGKALLEMLEKDSAAALLYGRFPATDQMHKRLLLQAGFFACEAVLMLYLPGLQSYELSPSYKKHVLPLSVATAADYASIEAASAGMFHFSRFHEDPFIAATLADQRMIAWVKDLIVRKVPALVYKTAQGELISFMFYEKEKQKIRMLLGGSVQDKGMYSPFFWGSLLQYFQQDGAEKITGTVSAANTGVLSIYMDLKFKIAETLFDYHKHR